MNSSSVTVNSPPEARTAETPTSNAAEMVAGADGRSGVAAPVINQERNARILALADAGHSASEIGRTLCMTRNAVIGVCFRARASLHGKRWKNSTKPAKPFRAARPFTTQETEQIRRMILDGSSHRQVGRTLGRAATSILKKCRQLGIKSQAHAHIHVAFKVSSITGQPKLDRAEPGAFNPNPNMPKQGEGIQPLASKQPQEPKGCRYITGDPKTPDWRYCQHKQAPGSSYCPDHHVICCANPEIARMLLARTMEKAAA